MTEPITGDEVYTPKLKSQAKSRRFVSQNGRGYLAIGIYDSDNNPVDPEPGTLNLKVYLNLLDGSSSDPRGNLIVDVDDSEIIRDDVGKYHYDIGPQWTSERGTLTAEWTYDANGAGFQFNDDMQILDQMPMFDRLREDTRLQVEQAGWYFADLFDSTTGGPWVTENFQTHFNYERIAFLLGQAVMKFNVLGYPVTAYGVDVGSQAVPANFGPLIIWATKLEIIRHLIASYTEQPEFRNMTTTYTDRRDYARRWREVLDEEKPEMEKAIKMAKRSLLNLGRGSLLVSGGIYGGSSRIFVPGIYASQTRAFRFYPAAPSVSWGAQAKGGSW